MLSNEQATRFKRDGFLRLRGVVPKASVLAARRQIFERIGALRQAAGSASDSGETARLAEATRLMNRSGGSEAIMNLFNASPLKKLVSYAFDAPVYPVRGAQLATLYPAEDDLKTNESGYLNEDTPHFGWCGHLDGLWNGGIATPAAGSKLNAEEERGWNSDPSTNGGKRRYPEHDCNIANFTALVGVALSDQRSEGAGNLGFLRGGHRHMEAFFRRQRDLGGPLGPEGPGWPREDLHAPNGHGLVHYPQAVRLRYRRTAVAGNDDTLWPKPTWMRLKPTCGKPSP